MGCLSCGPFNRCVSSACCFGERDLGAALASRWRRKRNEALTTGRRTRSARACQNSVDKGAGGCLLLLIDASEHGRPRGARGKQRARGARRGQESCQCLGARRCRLATRCRSIAACQRRSACCNGPRRSWVCATTLPRPVARLTSSHANRLPGLRVQVAWARKVQRRGATTDTSRPRPRCFAAGPVEKVRAGKAGIPVDGPFKTLVGFLALPACLARRCSPRCAGTARCKHRRSSRIGLALRGASISRGAPERGGRCWSSEKIHSFDVGARGSGLARQ